MVNRTVNFEYLLQLPNPHQAVTADLWNEWKEIPVDERITKVLNLNARDAASKLGIVWGGNATDKVEDVLGLSIDDVREKKHVSEGWRKAVTLLMARLDELDEETLERLTFEPISKNEEKELERTMAFENIYRLLTKHLTNMTKEVTNDNFEVTFKGFLKLLFGHVASSGTYTPDDMGRYLTILMKRYFDCKTMTVIAEEVGTSQSMVNISLNRFNVDFTNYLLDDNERHFKLFKKYERFCDKVLSVLDDSNLKNRNERLYRCRFFEEHLLPRVECVDIDIDMEEHVCNCGGNCACNTDVIEETHEKCADCPNEVCQCK